VSFTCQSATTYLEYWLVPELILAFAAVKQLKLAREMVVCCVLACEDSPRMFSGLHEETKDDAKQTSQTRMLKNKHLIPRMATFYFEPIGIRQN
jgi:hypothetical protein